MPEGGGVGSSSEGLCGMGGWGNSQWLENNALKNKIIASLVI